MFCPRGSRLAAFGVLVLASVGCAMLPPPPAGPPIASGQVVYSVTVGVNLAAAHATVVTDDGVTQSLGGNGDLAAGKYDLLGTLANPRFALRYAPRPQLDLGGYAGGWDAGFAVRHFLWEDFRRTATGSPLALTAGAQVGYALFFDRPALPRPWQVQVAVETHPNIRGYGPSLLGVGLSYGRRRHGLLVPQALVPADQSQPYPLTRLDFEISRTELRLEVALGTVIVGPGTGTATLTVLPYWVVHAGTPSGGCACVGNPRLDDFSQSWGIAVVVGPYAVLDTQRDAGAVTP